MLIPEASIRILVERDEIPDALQVDTGIIQQVQCFQNHQGIHGRTHTHRLIGQGPEAGVPPRRGITGAIHVSLVQPHHIFGDRNAVDLAQPSQIPQGGDGIARGAQGTVIEL